MAAKLVERVNLQRIVGEAERPRILFVEHHGQIVGGGQFSLLALMQNLKCCDPFCVTGGEGSMTDAVRAAGVEGGVVDMPALKLGNLIAGFRCAAELCRIARKHRVGLLHANGSRSMFYAGLVAKFLRVPVCWHVRIVDSDGWWDRLLANWATSIIAISGAVANRFADLEAEDKVCVVYNGVDIDKFARGDRAAWRAHWGWGERLVVGMVAQLIEWKRQDIFIAAVAVLAERFPDVLFALVGAEPDTAQGYESVLRAQVAELGLQDKVVFTGFCDDTPGVFAALDVVVLTSDNEPFGRVLIEAMAAAKPVVATEGGGVPEIVVAGQTGLLVSVGDALATADAVGSLLADSEKAGRFADAGLQRARNVFSIAAHVQGVEAVFADVLESNENRQ